MISTFYQSISHIHHKNHLFLIPHEFSSKKHFPVIFPHFSFLFMKLIFWLFHFHHFYLFRYYSIHQISMPFLPSSVLYSLPNRFTQWVKQLLLFLTNIVPLSSTSTRMPTTPSSSPSSSSSPLNPSTGPMPLKTRTTRYSFVLNLPIRS